MRDMICLSEYEVDRIVSEKWLKASLRLDYTAAIHWLSIKTALKDQVVHYNFVRKLLQ